MKLRSFFYILVTFVLAVLLVGAGGFFWLTSQNPLALARGGSLTTPEASIFVSRQAPLMASLLVNPERLEAFRQIVTPPAQRRQARAELSQFKQTLLANTELDYQKDIQPWLGNEVTLALTTLDIDRDGGNGRQPGYLLAVATQDAQRSREFLQLFWQKRALSGLELVFEQYKGVKLISASDTTPEQAPEGNRRSQTSPASPPPIPTLSTAVVGDRFILFGNHPKVLREAINNVQASELNLENYPSYQRAVENLRQNRIGMVFVNLPRLSTWLGSGSGSTPPATDPTSTPTFEDLAIALGLHPQGLLSETALLTMAESQVSPSLTALSKPVGALQYLPASTSLSASGQDLKQLWNGVSRNLAGYEGASQVVNQFLSSLETRWGVQLPEDIFSWVKGEYALGLVPGASGTKAEVDWVFVAERGTGNTTQTAIDRLDALARKQGLSVGPLQLGDRAVSVWTRLATVPKSQKSGNILTLQADIRGVRVSVGQYELFATSVEAMDLALRSGEAGLAESDQFARAISPLSRPNNGYLYLDWLSLQPFLERQFPLARVVRLAGQPLFDHLRSLSLSSYGGQSGVQRGGLFIQLGN